MSDAAELSQLVTLEEYKAFVDGAEIEQTRLAAVVSAVRGFCGWHIAPSRRETLTIDGNGSSALLLPSLHITEVHSVRENGGELDDVQWSEKGMLRHPTLWTDRWRGVEVDLTHGYTTAPAEITAAIFDLVAQAVDAGPGQEPEQIGPFKYGASEGGIRFPGHVLAVLRRYRIDLT
ncbi:hypothetical protein GS966_20035 [Rhodococcus hoagii]|nr:hypothetical protein [Prescottella equi]NKZ92217.1 hypothetical protein [Prescottella equi]